MGNMSKKLKKKQLKELAKKGNAENEKVKKEFLDLIEKGEYAEALNYIAPHISAHKKDGDIMYKIAYAYFMLDDYERATKWADTTLSIAPNHAETRVLLARICLLEDRTEEALAIFNVILGSFIGKLSDETKVDVSDILEFYGRTQREKIIRDYPHIASFLKLEEDEKEAKEEQNIEAPSSSIPQEQNEDQALEANTSLSMLQKLKAQLAHNKEGLLSEKKEEKEAPPVEIKTEAKEVEEAKAQEEIKAASKKAPTEENPTDILQRLKAQVAKNKMATEEKSEGREEEKPLVAPPIACDEEHDQKIEDEKKENQKEEKHLKGDLKSEELIESIMHQNISLQDKLKTLQQIAGGHFVQGEDEQAELFLTKALAIDTLNQKTLLGLAYLALHRGERQKALDIASHLEEVDFHLLETLRELKD